MTNSKTTQCGIYQVSKKILCLETGYNIEMIEKLIKRFEDYGKIKFDSEQNEVFLVNWIKHNPINNVNIKKCVEKELLNVKSPSLVRDFETITKGLVRGLVTPTKYKEKEKEKEKEEIQEKEKTIKSKPDFESYTSNSELVETLKSFIEFRKKIKSPMTDHAIKLLLGNLDKLSDSDDEKIEILNQSIMNGWKSVYAIKNKGGVKVAEFRNRDKERSNEYDALSF